MRKFNIEMYKDYLNKEIANRKMKRKTAEAYVRLLCRLNDTLPDGDFSCEELGDRIDYLSSLNGSTQGAKFIKAVKKYEKGVCGTTGVYLYGEVLSALYRKYKPQGIVEIRHDISTYERKINGISNQQMDMKLALRLQMRSGLRVFELAKLRREDVIFGEEGMQIQVLGGKGNKNRLVDVLPDQWLEQHLRVYMQDKEGRLFPCETDIERFARKIDIKTHELRKVYARVLYRQLRGEGESMSKSRKAVGHELGHDGKYAGTVTNLYLGKEWEYTQNKQNSGKPTTERVEKKEQYQVEH